MPLIADASEFSAYQKDDPMSQDSKERARAIEMALTQIEKQFGKGSIMRLGGAEIIDVPVIPTGALSLDMALGVGGIPRGRVIEIYGPESGGKTTLALQIVAEAQRLGIHGVPFFVLEGRYGVSGAQPVEVLVEALQQSTGAAPRA